MWPEDKTDELLLKASLSAARHRIAEFLGINPMNQQNGDNGSKRSLKGGIGNIIPQEDLAPCANKLQEPYKTAVLLHCVEEQSYLEIARSLNLPEGTIKSHVSRGMKMIFG